jgi:hypothetical protein
MNKAVVLTWEVYSGVLSGIFPGVTEFLQLTTAYVYLASKIYAVWKEADKLTSCVYAHFCIIKISRVMAARLIFLMGNMKQ